MLVIMGVDPVAEEEDTGNWCGGGRNGAWMNRSGSRPEAGVERYPHLLSVRAGRAGLSFKSSRREKGRTLTGNPRDLRRKRVRASSVVRRKGLDEGGL